MNKKTLPFTQRSWDKWSKTIKHHHVLVVVSLIILFILQVHNIWLFPVNRGYDVQGHIQYINYIKTHHSLPVPNQGWEFFQPPLYYLLASLLPNLFSVKILGFIFWIILCFIIFLFFKNKFRNSYLILAETIIAISLPVIISLTPTISNELFSILTISCALVCYSLNSKRGLKMDVLFAVLLALALLVKSTAIILFISVLIDFLISKKKKILNIAIILLILSIVSGWFYWRNFMLYKKPLIMNLDIKSFSNGFNPPPRQLSFFTDITSFIKADLFQAHHYSFLSGTYYSFFYDGQNIIVPVQQFSKAGLTLVIFSLPLVVFFFIGVINELKSKNKNKLFLIYPLLLFTSYVYLNIKYPIYGSTNARYIASGIIPFAYFVIHGLKSIKLSIKVINLYLLIYIILIIKNFWILNNWYK